MSTCCRDRRMSMIIFFNVLLCCLSFHVSILSAATTSTNTSTPDLAASFLVNCGASDSSSDADGRTWVDDVRSNFTLSSLKATSTDTAKNLADVPSTPYSSARFSTSNFTYSFPVSPGRYFIRLHFNPTNYTNHADYLARFSVTSGQFTLLNNFSSSQTAQALNLDYLLREYSIVVSEALNLTFAPSSILPNSYAFVNGIQIVPMTDIFNSTNQRVVASSVVYPIGSDVAFETAYRLNVGGNYISPGHDSGLFREWFDDSPYIYGAGFGVTYSNDTNVTINMDKVPSFVAPWDVYGSARSMGSNAQVNLKYNLTWILTVDSGFYYLVRLHFCEIQSPITKPNQRVFDVFIHNQTAEEGFDVITWSGGIGDPIFKDYVVILSPLPEGTGRQDLWISLHPDVSQKPQYYDAILNGMEVFKLSSNGNLAGPNPIPSISESNPNIDLPQGKKGHVPAIVGGAVGGATFALFCLALLIICCRRQRKEGGKEPGSSEASWLPLSLHEKSPTDGSARTNITRSNASSLPSNLGRHFSFAEIEAATDGFADSLLLGVGGFGKVFRGTIDGGSTKVAIKRANPMSEQGIHEFQTEIEMLSKLRHLHLVSLIGYCQENSEMILVYDYMAHGTLREHLYKTRNPPLPWKQRLEICIGAARGLHYLHTGAKYTIIHRDVKTTNILLDEKWVAKVSDFGLSKTGPTLDNTHVSTVVKGSFGYLDPEYFRRQQLTDKSDVYSFGVVLFEVLCARPVLDRQLPKEQVSLAEWALHCQKRGLLDQLIDPHLHGKIAPQCLKKFAETAEKCLNDNGIERPSMGDVLWNLEFALQLQESAEESGDVIISGDSSKEDGHLTMIKKNLIDPLVDSSYGTTPTTSSMSMEGQSNASIDSDGLKPSTVFSQIMDPKGR